MATTRAHTNAKPRIGTHNGVFHADDVLGCYMLTHHVERFQSATIVRTRDKSVLDECDALVDVGGVSDASSCRFDHHQRHFDETFSPDHCVRLSSAGLVFKRFGHEIITNVLESHNLLEKCRSSLDLLVVKTYEHFVEAIDGKDNGIEAHTCVMKNCKPIYKNITDLTSRISRMNPFWNDSHSADLIMDNFEKATEVAGREFVQAVYYLSSCWLPARKIVNDAVSKRFEIDDSGLIICLGRFLPWQEHLADLEDEEMITPPPVYVIYLDVASRTYRVQAVPTSPGSFDNRLPLPQEWRGLSSETLSELIGVEGCTFAHRQGFTCGNATKEGAIAMARLSLRQQGERLFIDEARSTSPSVSTDTDELSSDDCNEESEARKPSMGVVVRRNGALKPNFFPTDEGITSGESLSLSLSLSLGLELERTERQFVQKDEYDGSGGVCAVKTDAPCQIFGFWNFFTQ